jgi:Fic family protein
MRRYEETHPWIDFHLDLDKGPRDLWLLLGEAQSKCSHISGVPLLPEVAAELYKVFLVKGVMATTAIEGNTLTEEQIRKAVDGELELPPSKQYLGQEVDNVVAAVTEIATPLLAEGAASLCVEDILRFNGMVLRDLPNSKEAQAGSVRKYEVGVGSYRGAPSEDCGYLLDRLCEWLPGAVSVDKANHIAYGILKAVLCHLYIAWIHPFGDGNGRTARLAEFHILLSSGVPAAAAHLLSNHYNQTRQEYYRQLDRTSITREVFPFIQYAVQGFVDGLQEQLTMIEQQQIKVLWKNHVYDRFGANLGKIEERRRMLMLEISAEYFRRAQGIPLEGIRYLSPRIAEAYHGKVEKTLRRDLEELKRMDLLRIGGAGQLRPFIERMQAYLSPVVPPALH